jgi:DNA-binding beta-propeller fold protein YncE
MFQNPRDLAVAPDGSLYVVDSDNNRIQHLSPEGEVLHVWGSFGDITAGDAPGGSFSQPWGIGLGPDGAVYVADTWNHRVQKFSPEGEFLGMWGFFGQGESSLAFWGPRDVAVDGKGQVFVTDTGNKRVVVFDEQGTYLTQFGGAGFGPGQFDEPVGIVVDEDGRIYVADTWNQRVQTFVDNNDGSFSPESEWDVAAWYGQSLDNKPYLDVDEGGRVFASDPDGFRILEFSATGEPVQFWGDYGSGLDTFGLPASVAADREGGVWVTDARNGRLMHFVPPPPSLD